MFYRIGDVIIDFDHVTDANLNDDGAVSLAVGNRTLRFEGDHADQLRMLFGGASVRNPPGDPHGRLPAIQVRDIATAQPLTAAVG